MLNTPGITVAKALQGMKHEELLRYVDSTLLELISAVDPDLIGANEISKHIELLIDSTATIEDEGRRNEIIDLLPISKASELADRLGIAKDRDIYDSLRKSASEPVNRSIIDSFFGIVKRPDSRKSVDSATKTIESVYSLYTHQRRAVERVEELLNYPPRKVLLHMPTGSGKTRTAMHVVANFLRTREPAVVCWFAYSSELLEQATNEFEVAWNSLGNRPIQVFRNWGNRKLKLLALKDGIVVSGLSKMFAMDQRDPNLLPRFGDRCSLIVIDEAHQAIAPTYAGILDALYTKRPDNALLGLTATPGRTWSDIAEDRKLSEYFGARKVSLEVEGFTDPVRYLISQGYLARPIFQQIDGQAECSFSQANLNKIAVSSDVPDRILEDLGRDASRNRVIVSKIEELMHVHHRTLVFTPSVESAIAIVTVLRLRNVAADCVTAKTPQSEREAIIRRFRSSGGRPRVLINFGVLTTGFDAPSTSAAIIARPTKSLVLYSQMVGRATRGHRVGGNKTAVIVSVVDTNLPGFGSISEAFTNWEDVWSE